MLCVLYSKELSSSTYKFWDNTFPLPLLFVILTYWALRCRRQPENVRHISDTHTQYYCDFKRTITRVKLRKIKSGCFNLDQTQSTDNIMSFCLSSHPISVPKPTAELSHPSLFQCHWHNPGTRLIQLLQPNPVKTEPRATPIPLTQIQPSLAQTHYHEDEEHGQLFKCTSNTNDSIHFTKQTLSL